MYESKQVNHLKRSEIQIDRGREVHAKMELRRCATKSKFTRGTRIHVEEKSTWM